jgi:hypothetical protein
MTIEAMKLALEALNKNVGELRVAGARHILKTAIKQAENQDAWKTSDTAYRPGGLPQDVQAEEPVAWVNRGENIIERVAGWDGYGALYTAPHTAQRQWVGLTDADKREFAAAQYSWEELCSAVDQRLQEKNT